MSIYLKGGIVAILVIIGLLFWYQKNIDKLPANRTPEDFKVVARMEKEGVPNFTLAKLDGAQVSLEQYRGKVVIVNFWASWCNPCVEEFPSMLKLVERFNGDVVVLAVSTDDDRNDIEVFTKAFNLPKPNFDVLWDQEKSVMKTYGVEKIPESFLVGKDGKLVRKVLGIEDWASEDAIRYFASLTGRSLEEPAPSAE